MIPLRYNLRSLTRRRIRTLMTVTGISVAIAIYSIMGAVAETMVKRFQATGLEDEVVIVEGGAISVDFSNIARSSLAYVQTLQGVAQDGRVPLVSPELYLGSVVKNKDVEHDVAVRGVTAIAGNIYRQVTLADGDWPRTGLRAAIGTAIARQLELNVGDEFELEGERWTVSGILDGGDKVYDQEIWVELEELSVAAKRSTLSHYVVRAVDAMAAAKLIETVNEGRRYPLLARTAPEFYASAGVMSIFMAFIGRFIAIIVAIGAALGGMNTMYSAVAGRRREIGILRVLGYRRRSVLFSFLCESWLISMIGGVAGLMLGFILSSVSLIDLPYLVENRVSIGAAQVGSSLILALIIGLVGGLLPSLNAARTPLIESLRK
jgi:putative ABC transport system permease protein